MLTEFFSSSLTSTNAFSPSFVSISFSVPGMTSEVSAPVIEIAIPGTADTGLVVPAPLDPITSITALENSTSLRRFMMASLPSDRAIRAKANHPSDLTTGQRDCVTMASSAFARPAAMQCKRGRISSTMSGKYFIEAGDRTHRQTAATIREISNLIDRSSVLLKSVRS